MMALKSRGCRKARSLTAFDDSLQQSQIFSVRVPHRIRHEGRNPSREARWRAPIAQCHSRASAPTDSHVQLVSIRNGPLLYVHVAPIAPKRYAVEAFTTASASISTSILESMSALTSIVRSVSVSF